MPLLETAITIATILPIAGTASAAVRAGTVGSRFTRAALASRRLVVPALTISHRVLKSSQDTSICFKKYAIFMGSSKKFDVIGGPTSENVKIEDGPEGSLTQVISSPLPIALHVFQDGHLLS